MKHHERFQLFCSRLNICSSNPRAQILHRASCVTLLKPWLNSCGVRSPVALGFSKQADVTISGVSSLGEVTDPVAELAARWARHLLCWHPVSSPCWALGCAGALQAVTCSLAAPCPGDCQAAAGMSRYKSATAKLTIAHLTELRITLPWSYVKEINPLEEGGTCFIGFWK